VVSIPEGNIDVVNSAPAIMDQVKRQFEPLVLAVEKGREVVFPNSDNIRHHVYSFSEPKKLQIKLYKDNPNKPIKFDQDGIVVLGCNIHDSMIGFIFVSPWSSFQVSNESGQVSFEGHPKEVAIWHPWVKGLEKPKRINFSELKKNNFKITLLLTPPKQTTKLKNKFKKYYKK
jgi:plastocyanin